MPMQPVVRTRRSQPSSLGELGADAGADVDVGSGIQKFLSSVGGQVARESVKRVYFRSQISPDIEIDPGQALGTEPPRGVREGGVSELFLRIAKPALYVDTRLGMMKVAPWGEPEINLYPAMIVGSLAGLAIGVGLVLRGLKR